MSNYFNSFLAVLVVLVVFLGGCGSEPSQPPEYTISASFSSATGGARMDVTLANNGSAVTVNGATLLSAAGTPFIANADGSFNAPVEGGNFATPAEVKFTSATAASGDTFSAMGGCDLQLTGGGGGGLSCTLTKPGGQTLYASASLSTNVVRITFTTTVNTNNVSDNSSVNVIAPHSIQGTLSISSGQCSYTLNGQIDASGPNAIAKNFDVTPGSTNPTTCPTIASVQIIAPGVASPLATVPIPQGTGNVAFATQGATSFSAVPYDGNGNQVK